MPNFGIWSRFPSFLRGENGFKTIISWPFLGGGQRLGFQWCKLRKKMMIEKFNIIFLSSPLLSWKLGNVLSNLQKWVTSVFTPEYNGGVDHYVSLFPRVARIIRKSWISSACLRLNFSPPRVIFIGGKRWLFLSFFSRDDGKSLERVPYFSSDRRLTIEIKEAPQKEPFLTICQLFRVFFFSPLFFPLVLSLSREATWPSP